MSHTTPAAQGYFKINHWCLLSLGLIFLFLTLKSGFLPHWINVSVADISLILQLQQQEQEYVEIFRLQCSYSNLCCLLISSILVTIFVAQQQEDDPLIFNLPYKPRIGSNFLIRETAVREHKGSWTRVKMAKKEQINPLHAVSVSIPAYYFVQDAIYYIHVVFLLAALCKHFSLLLVFFNVNSGFMKKCWDVFIIHILLLFFCLCFHISSSAVPHSSWNNG